MIKMRSVDTRTNFSDFVHLETQVLMLKMINMTCIDTSNNLRTFWISRTQFWLLNMMWLDTRTNLMSLLISRHIF